MYVLIMYVQGIKIGDEIEAIDGVSVAGLSLESVKRRIAGPIGAYEYSYLLYL